MKMKRIEAFLAHQPQFPDDVETLRSIIPVLQDLTPVQIASLYSEWSEQDYCASWLILSPETIDEFAAWLDEEVSGFWME